jgi:hypothetical protein
LKAHDVEDLLIGLIISTSRWVSLNIHKKVRKSSGRMDRVGRVFTLELIMVYPTT